MASATQPRRRRDSLGPNPFRLRPRATHEVAQQKPAPRSPTPLQSLLDPCPLKKPSSSTNAKRHSSHCVRSGTLEPSTLHLAARQDMNSSTPQVLLPAIQSAAIQEDQDHVHGHTASCLHDGPSLSSVSPRLSNNHSPNPCSFLNQGHLDIFTPPRTSRAGSLFPLHPQLKLPSDGILSEGEDADSNPTAQAMSDLSSLSAGSLLSPYPQSEPPEDRTLSEGEDADSNPTTQAIFDLSSLSAGSLLSPYPQSEPPEDRTLSKGDDANSDLFRQARQFISDIFSPSRWLQFPSIAWGPPQASRSLPLIQDLGANHLRIPLAEREAHRKAFKGRQAWLLSPLGKLPAEIREMIYTYALTIPTSQSPITIRRSSVEKKADSDKASLMNSAASVDSSSAIGPKASNLAILQTCRVIHREAQDTYYASNAFHTRSAQDLHTFLLGIGLARCEVLTTLHIEGLLIQEPMFPKDWLDEQQKEGHLMDTRYETMSKYTRWALGSTGEAASKLLKECKRLRKVYLLMETFDECSNIIEHVDFARGLTGDMWENKVDFIDGSHWVVRLASPTEEWYPALLKAVYDYEIRAVLFPPPAEGQQRCVEVDIRMDLKVDEM